MDFSMFDPVEFVKRPHTIARLVSWFCAIIVFSCISAEGWMDSKCLYNHDSGACGFPTFVGVIAFLACMIFLVIDTQFDQWSNIQWRQYFLVADLVFSGLWSFFWFVCFVYTASAWGSAFKNDQIDNKVLNAVRGNMQAAIAFCFFSIISWAVLTLMAFQRFRSGAARDFTAFDQHESVGGGGGGFGGGDYKPYAGGIGGGAGADASNTSPYQPGPFNDTSNKPPPSSAGGGYQTQNY